MLHLIKTKIALAIFFIGFSDISSLKSFIDINHVQNDLYSITFRSGPLKPLTIDDADGKNTIGKIKNNLAFDVQAINTIWKIKNKLESYTFKLLTLDDAHVINTLHNLKNFAVFELHAINTIRKIKNKLAFDEHNISNPNFSFEEYVSLDDNSEFQYVNSNLHLLTDNIIKDIYHELSNYSDKSVSESEFDNIFQKKCHEEMSILFCVDSDSTKVEKLQIKKKKTVSAAQKLTPEEQKNLKSTYQRNELDFTKSKYIQAKTTAIGAINNLIGIKKHFVTKVDGLGRLKKQKQNKEQIKNDINNIINLMIESRYPDLKGKSLDNKKNYLLKTVAKYRFINENDISEYEEAIQYEQVLINSINTLYTEIKNTILNKYPALK